MAERYDAYCIRALFERCARIREVTVTLGKSDDQRRLHATTRAFKDLTTRPNCGGELNWKNEGTRQVRSVLKAVAATGRQLDSLTLGDVSHRIFTQHLDDAREETKNSSCSTLDLRAGVRPLRRLRLYVGTLTPSGTKADPIYMIEDAARELHEASTQGHIKEVIAEAQQLRVLKLQLPSYEQLLRSSCRLRRYRCHIRDLFPETTLP